MATRTKTVAPAVKGPAAKKAAPKKAAATTPRPPKAPAKLAAPAPAAPSAPAGWYPDPTADPTDGPMNRYWDGRDWLGAAVPEHLTPGGPPPSAGVTPVAPAEGGTTPPSTATVAWHGRDLTVQFPDEGQIVVWRRVARQFDGLTREQLVAMGDEKVGRMLDRGVSVIFSVLVADADKDWLEDGLLEKKWTLAEASEIIPLALAALNAQAGMTAKPNRAARRNTARARTPAKAR